MKKIENTRLVQDVIAYCEETNTPGLIAFADQSKAYDRVSWEFVSKVMKQMNFPDHFITLSNLLNNKSSVSIKVNGHKGERFTPSNSLKQGCPASPCYYLIAFQPFLSLLNNAVRDGTVTGITIPGADGKGVSKVIAASFADDLAVFLRDARELPVFKALLDIYEKGSGFLLGDVCL